jgi:ribosomal protein L28
LRTLSTASTGNPGRSSPRPSTERTFPVSLVGTTISARKQERPVFSSVKLSADTVRTVPENSGSERL